MYDLYVQENIKNMEKFSRELVIITKRNLRIERTQLKFAVIHKFTSEIDVAEERIVPQ